MTARLPYLLAAILLVVSAGAPVAAAGLTARVESPNGAPRIVINGQPVRARMFFGAPGSSASPIGPEWQQVDFEFTGIGSADTGTMHFRFGHGAGDVFVDKIQVTDFDDNRDVIPPGDFAEGQRAFERDWTFWPAGPTNTVGRIAVEAQAGQGGGPGWHIQLTEPPDGPTPFPARPSAKGHRWRCRCIAAKRECSRWTSSDKSTHTRHCESELI